MIINADALLPHLREKVRPTQTDASRHILCPSCGLRTKLNVLADGRRKCTVCGKKFRIHKVTQLNKLQQCAEVLLCFCLDFSPYRTAQITHHRHQLVAAFYDHFRRLLTEASLSEEKIRLLMDHKGNIHVLRGNARCQWCNSPVRPAAAKGKAPVFGIQFRDSGDVFIDPLKDDEAILHFHSSGPRDDAPGRREGYAGFICCGKFHRFSKEARQKNVRTRGDAEQLWTWIRERVRSHHGIWKKNTGYYLKELEWKYNKRTLAPEEQALKLIELMPMNFLTAWSLRTGGLPGVQKRGKVYPE